MGNKVSVEISANVKGFQQGMNEATESAQAYETETRKVADAQVNLMKELKAAKREVQNLAAGYAKLDAEAKQSAFGREMKIQLDEAKKAAAEYIDLQGDLNTELKNMASDTAALDTLSEGMSVLMNTTSAALGIIAQFTGNEKDAQRAVVAFTTAQSVLNTITGIANALQAQSATMIAVRKVQELALSAAISIRNAAETKGIVLTKAATVAQALFNKVAMANPYVLLATAILTVVTAIGTYIMMTSDAEDEEKKHQAELERTQKKLENLAQAYVSSAGQAQNTASRLEHLRIAIKNTNDEAKKTAMLEEAAKYFKELGLEVKGVTDAERILVKEGDKVIELIRLQGDMAAVSAMRMEAYKKTLQGLMQLGFNAAEAVNIARYSKEVQELDKALDTLQDKASKLSKGLGIKSSSTNTKSTVKTKQETKVEVKVEQGSVEEAEKKLKELEEIRSKMSIEHPDKDIKDINDKIEKQKKLIEQRKIKIGIEIDKTSAQKLSADAKKIQDDINNVEGDFIVAFANQDYEAMDKLQDQYDKLIAKQKAYNDTKAAAKLQLEGPTITPKIDYNKVKDALSGNVEKSIEGYEDAINTLQAKMKSIDWNEEGATEMWDHCVEKIVEYKQELYTMEDAFDEGMLTPMEKAIKHADKLAKKYNLVADCCNSVGDAFSALSEIADDDPALNIMGIVAQAVANVFAGYAQATVAASQTGNPWVWLAFALTGLATTLSMVAQIKSAAQFDAGGIFEDSGIVSGSLYHGDRINARLNSGEMILNKRQQRNLFNLLDTDVMPQRGGTNVRVEGVIRGTDLLLVQQNTNKVRSKTGTQIYF